jgi:hypothetical protein
MRDKRWNNSGQLVRDMPGAVLARQAAGRQTLDWGKTDILPTRPG